MNYLLITAVGYIFSFLLKKQIYALLSALLNSVNNPLGFIAGQLDKTRSVLEGVTFSKIVLNILVAFCATAMIIAEFGSLQGILAALYGTKPIPGIGLPLASVNAIVYIAIATLVGFLALEWLGFKKLIAEVLISKSLNDTNVKDWIAFRHLYTVPYNTFKTILGILFLTALFIFAYWQGNLGVVRDELSPGAILESSPLEVKEMAKTTSRAVAFLLGFFTPILASIALLTVDIMVSIAIWVIVFTIKLSVKMISGAYYVTKESIELVTGPVKYTTDKINYVTNEKTKIYIEPLKVESDTFAINEQGTLVNYISNNEAFEKIVIDVSIDSSKYLKEFENMTGKNVEEFLKNVVDDVANNIKEQVDKIELSS